MVWGKQVTPRELKPRPEEVAIYQKNKVSALRRARQTRVAVDAWMRVFLGKDLRDGVCGSWCMLFGCVTMDRMWL